jgi:hypothetical protein
MNAKLEAKRALIIAELHLLGVPVPLSLEPYHAVKNTAVHYRVSHRSGLIENGEQRQYRLPYYATPIQQADLPAAGSRGLMQAHLCPAASEEAHYLGHGFLMWPKLTFLGRLDDLLLR